MKCVVCKQGQTAPGNATVTLERGGSTLVFKHVPARVCSNCGEEYVDEEAARHILRVADEAANAGVQVGIREYMAA
jgi:YgiT-type zinc finger domain-containing protein